MPRRWTQEDLALLGKVPDAEVARRTGRSIITVQQARGKRGIPNPAPSKAWTAEDDELVRTLPPAEAARRTGRGLQAVQRRRVKLGLTALPASPE
jgi:hypothetical protein